MLQMVLIQFYVVLDRESTFCVKIVQNAPHRALHHALQPPHTHITALAHSALLQPPFRPSPLRNILDAILDRILNLEEQGGLLRVQSLYLVKLPHLCGEGVLVEALKRRRNLP